MKEPMILDHPLIKHKVSHLRDINTGTKEFKELVSEIAMLMCYEATRDMPTETVEITTPITTDKFEVLAGRKLAVVPILRAGLGMVEGFMQLMPDCKVGHLGMYRDEETFQPVPYYSNYPKDISERDTVLLDPMLATGGSAEAAVDFVKDKGAKNVRLMCIVAARQGVAHLLEKHPDIKIYAAAFDEELTPKAYINPGLGDAGDRLFGTL